MRSAFVALLFTGAALGSPVATYTFNNTLNAQQGGVASLTAVDPLSASGFTTATVFGSSRTVYHFDGLSSPPSDQGGLNLDVTGLIGTNNYSVEMVFELDDRNNAWRRLMDSLDRTSDAGLYIDPGNHIDVFPAGGSGSPFTPATFFDVFVTVDSSNQITGYFSGVQQLQLTSSALDIQSHFLSFFLDNTVGGGQGEWSKGDISLIKIFNTALTPAEVLAETADPFQGTTPEPSTAILLTAGIAGFVLYRRRAAACVR
jgi:hypothetical protein